MTDTDPSAELAAGSPEQRAAALLAQAKHLVDDLEQHDQAVVLLDRILDEFGDVPELVVQQCRAEALFWKSQALLDLGRIDEGLRVCEQLTAIFGDAAAISLRKTVCHALWVTAFTLRHEKLGREETIVALCDVGIERFGDETELWMRQRILHFMIDKSFALEKLVRRQDGVALRNAAFARYADDPDQSLREHAGRVLSAMDVRFGIQDAEKQENAAG